MIPAAREIGHLREHIGLRRPVVDGRWWHERDRHRRRVDLEWHACRHRRVVHRVGRREHGLERAAARREHRSGRRRVGEAAGDARGGIELRRGERRAVADRGRRGPGDRGRDLRDREGPCGAAGEVRAGERRRHGIRTGVHRGRRRRPVGRAADTRVRVVHPGQRAPRSGRRGRVDLSRTVVDEAAGRREREGPGRDGERIHRHGGRARGSGVVDRVGRREHDVVGPRPRGRRRAGVAEGEASRHARDPTAQRGGGKRLAEGQRGGRGVRRDRGRRLRDREVEALRADVAGVAHRGSDGVVAGIGRGRAAGAVGRAAATGITVGEAADARGTRGVGLRRAVVDEARGGRERDRTGRHAGRGDRDRGGADGRVEVG